MYFEMYGVSDQLKTRFAALNFKGTAAVWLHTLERRGLILDWEQFYTAVFTQFDKDQYQLLLRQLDSLSQTGTVTEYLTQFEELSHGILLYNSAYDDTYFVTRFLGGLTEDIRSAIALHRPADMQQASALALIQEEELEHSRHRSASRDYQKSSYKSTVSADKSKLNQFSVSQRLIKEILMTS